MNSLILCEGATDAILLSYYLGKEELEDLMKGENINLYSASAAGD